jgi:CheY-like chemotaxis protein
MILITKSYYMKKIETLGLNIFKTLYEPLNTTKLKSVLENYDASSFNEQKNKKARKKQFDEKNSKFAAHALVAEDNVINQKLIKRTLEDLGLTVTLANNGLEAFQKRKSGKFDIVFMDIQMPVLDGVEATQEILDYEEDFNLTHVPIIALTANALKGDRERFLNDGLDEYTTKPLVRSEIVSILNQFLSDFIVETNDKAVASETQSSETVQSDLPALEIIETPIEEVLQEVEATQDEPTPVISEEKAEPMLKEYKADILLTKKNKIETKLFARVLDELKYSYDIADNVSDMEEKLAENRYKLALFDKELAGLDLATLASKIKELDSEVYLVMMIDPASTVSENDGVYVHEIIKNIVNKDLLRLVFEKFV